MTDIYTLTSTSTESHNGDDAGRCHQRFSYDMLHTNNEYEVVSKTFRTGAAVYTAVESAQRICPNRPNYKFRVLPRRFVATAWKHIKTWPRTLARADPADSPWQRSGLTLPSSPSNFWRNTKSLPSPNHRTPLIWHTVISSCFQNWNWSWKDYGLIPLRRSRPNRRVLVTEREKYFQEAIQKWRKQWDRCLHAGGNYFEGDGDR
jgi:hypothetical protein